MTIVVREGVASMLRSAEGHPAALQIDCAERPAEAVAALRAARADIARLAPAEAPVAIEGPIPVPGGYLYWVDFGSATSPDRRAELPDILARHLEGAGITNAVIRPARRIGTRYEILNSFAPTVRTWLVGTNTEPVSGVPPSVPAVLVDLATQWLQARHDQNMELLAVILGLEIPLSPVTLPLFPAYVRTAGFYTFATLATDFAATYASALFGQFRGTGVTLAEAGRPAAQAVALMRDQRELIRAHAHLAELEWAGVSAAGRTPRPLIGQATVRSYQMLGPVWYQLLSADQLRRPGPIQPGAIELPGGRVELTVGEPEQWLPGRLLAGFLRPGMPQQPWWQAIGRRGPYARRSRLGAHRTAGPRRLPDALLLGRTVPGSSSSSTCSLRRGDRNASARRAAGAGPEFPVPCHRSVGGGVISACEDTTRKL
jgi:hypothetical protein